MTHDLPRLGASGAARVLRLSLAGLKLPATEARLQPEFIAGRRIYRADMVAAEYARRAAARSAP